MDLIFAGLTIIPFVYCQAVLTEVIVPIRRQNMFGGGNCVEQLFSWRTSGQLHCVEFNGYRKKSGDCCACVHEKAHLVIYFAYYANNLRTAWLFDQ